MEGDIGTIGITNHAQEQLGDVVFVDLPEVGSTVEKDETMGAVVAGHGFGVLGRSPQSAAQPSAPITALRLSIDSNCRLKTSCVAGLTFASRSSTEASFVTHSTSVSAAGRASFAASPRRHRLRLWVVGRALRAGEC